MVEHTMLHLISNGAAAQGWSLISCSLVLQVLDYLEKHQPEEEEEEEAADEEEEEEEEEQPK